MKYSELPFWLKEVMLQEVVKARRRETIKEAEEYIDDHDGDLNHCFVWDMTSQGEEFWYFLYSTEAENYHKATETFRAHQHLYSHEKKLAMSQSYYNKHFNTKESSEDPLLNIFNTSYDV